MRLRISWHFSALEVKPPIQLIDTVLSRVCKYTGNLTEVTLLIWTSIHRDGLMPSPENRSFLSGNCTAWLSGGVIFLRKPTCSPNAVRANQSFDALATATQCWWEGRSSPASPGTAVAAPAPRGRPVPRRLTVPARTPARSSGPGCPCWSRRSSNRT